MITVRTQATQGILKLLNSHRDIKTCVKKMNDVACPKAVNVGYYLL